MTREERINSALLPILKKMREHGATDKMCKMYGNGFHVGAMWAETHPHWISIENELPKENDFILIYGKDGVGVWLYESPNAEEKIIANHVTHWMPLPQPPKGDAK